MGCDFTLFKTNINFPNLLIQHIIHTVLASPAFLSPHNLKLVLSAFGI